MLPKIDVKIINPFIESALDCLRQMASLDPIRSNLFLKKNSKMLGDINGIIGITNGLTGSCVVSLHRPLAARIVAALLGEDVAEDDALIKDGIGELANMVAGGAKRRFHQSEFRFEISTPTVVMGNGPLEMHDPTGSICVCCEFKAHPDWDDTFAVEVAISPKS